MNFLAITGNLTSDPELSYTPTGKPVAHLRVAVNRPGKDANGNPYKAEFFSFEAWNGAENHAQYLTKGQQVEITGRLKHHEWTNDAGEKRSRVSHVAVNVQYGRKPNGDQPDTSPADADEASAETYNFDEEPF